jgi:dTDP-4-amino-4,6-dideoxygalactose transaminase
MSELALFGGKPAIDASVVPEKLFHWPIITKEDEDAVLDVLRRGVMSGLDVTEKFEKEFATWQQRKYAIGYCNGTMALQAAMYACKMGVGDEMICPSKTYWASCLQAFNLGSTVVFADIDPTTLCIDPKDIERCIGQRTKAIMVVHYVGHPADMDPIMEIANRYSLKVIEDVSHAQGGLYKGKKLGTFGDVAAMSIMSGKSLAAGEMGMLATDDKEIYDRAMAYCHYERNNPKYISTDYLKDYASMPLGGVKGRVNQLSSAVARVQLKYYDERAAEIRKAMKYFWSLLKGVPGIRPHMVDESDGSNMAGWYCPQGLYYPEELEGLSVERFCEAVAAEGFNSSVGANKPLHMHNIFKTYDGLNIGKPARIAYGRDVRELDKHIKVAQAVNVFSIPWFKHYMPEYIEMYANAFKKAALNYKELLAGDANRKEEGRWFFYSDKKETK